MLSDIFEINQEQAKQIYEFNILNNGNLIIFGASGIGKSEIAIDTCKDKDQPYEYLNLSVLEAVDLLGLPKSENNVTKHCTPEFLPLLNNKTKKTVLILDEIDKAADELQNPCLELLQFRSINGKKLNISSVIATGNLPNEHAKSRVLSWALTNRCSVFKMSCDFKAWAKWAVTNNLNPLIIGFLNYHPELLLKPNSSGDPTAYCSPSPRSWTLAAKDIDSFEQYIKQFSNKFKNDSVVNFEYMLLAGRIGLKSALDFKMWLKYYKDLGPDIDALIDTGKFPNVSKMTLDHIMVFAITGLNALNKACREQNIKQIKLIINNVFTWLNSQQVSPDLCYAAMKCVLTQNFVDQYDLLDYPVFDAVFNKIGKALDLF